MAAPPPPPPVVAAAPPAPVPANGPPLVTYREFFNDASNDAFNGNYADVLAPYGIGAAPLAPATIRNLVANARNQGVPTAFLLQH